MNTVICSKTSWNKIVDLIFMFIFLAKFYFNFDKPTSS